MKTLGVIANCTKPMAGKMLRRFGKRASALGLRLLADGDAADLLGMQKWTPHTEMFRQVDAIVAMGGDGTMLRVVRELAGRNIPVIGVNIGSLGFMTSVSEEELDNALECLAKDRCVESVRAVADAWVVAKNGSTMNYRALNDVVLRCGPSIRVASLDLAINGQTVASYMCDGIIVSTPTGSTGHSMSAGGPIIHPESKAFVLTVICPHTLSSRPLVLPDSSTITIRVNEYDKELLLSIDGQIGHGMKTGDSIQVQRSRKSVRFLHLPEYSYFGVLRQKLHWRGTNI